MKNKLFIISLMALCMIACNTQKTQQTTENATTNSVQTLEGKRWKLTEVFGTPVKNATPEAFIIFRAEGNKVNGNSGCNTFMGSYELGVGNRLRFSQLAATQKMCLDMDTEIKFQQALNTADSYLINGDTLILNRARMAPLARFVAVYLD